MKRVVVTGASGFVGSRLLPLLSNKSVRLLVRSIQDNLDYEQVQCNFEDANIPKDCFLGVSEVFHLAGVAHDTKSDQKNGELYYQVNVRATMALARLAASSGVRRFIFVSSVKSGGIPAQGKCASESDQGQPDGIYGKTKREAELKLLEIGMQSGMQVSIIRPALVYGPDQKGNLYSMLSAIEKGWFPPLPNVKNRRSMIHVDDLARAILLVSESDQANGEILIATDGRSYSSRDIYETMCRITGKSAPKWSVPKFIFDLLSMTSPNVKYRVKKLFGDECYSSEKLQSIGFRPQCTLRDMGRTLF